MLLNENWRNPIKIPFQDLLNKSFVVDICSCVRQHKFSKHYKKIPESYGALRKVFSKFLPVSTSVRTLLAESTIQKDSGR